MRGCTWACHLHMTAAHEHLLCMGVLRPPPRRSDPTPAARSVLAGGHARRRRRRAQNAPRRPAAGRGVRHTEPQRPAGAASPPPSAPCPRHGCGDARREGARERNCHRARRGMHVASAWPAPLPPLLLTHSAAPARPQREARRKGREEAGGAAGLRHRPAQCPLPVTQRIPSCTATDRGKGLPAASVRQLGRSASVPVLTPLER
eukprot:gene15112-biopygen4089